MSAIPNIDISPEQWDIVSGVLQRHLPGLEVWAFGSRAKWSAKQYSDLDLAVLSAHPLSLPTAAAIADDFSESNLPWKVDLVDWSSISDAFRKIVERDKVVIQTAGRARANGGWPRERIGKLAQVFDGPHATPKKTSTGPIFLGITCLEDGRLNLDHAEHLSEEDYAVWTRRVEPTGGDVVFSYETKLGAAAIIPEGLRCCLGRRMGLVRPDPNRLDARYFLYQYLGPEFQSLLKSRTIHGSTVDRISIKEFPDFEIAVPPVEIQRESAKVLGEIDDKIELNRRMNETLECMARAIFQSWFVDFDPVRAKTNGEDAESIRQRLGLPRDILDMFPDSFAESELGSIPAGWAVTTLRSMTSKIGSGATPRGGREVYLDEGVSLIRSQNVYDSEFVWNGLAHITDDAAKQLSGVEVKAGDVLINITGASILRTCVVDPHVLPARVNQHVAIVRAKSPRASRYLHLHLLGPATKSYLLGLNAGASREAVTKGHLESVPIIDPGSSLLQRFAGTVAPLYAMCEMLSRETRNLQCLRDALLPRLLSGKLEPQSQLPGIADERGMILSADAG